MNRKIVNDKQYLPKSMYNRRKIPQMQNTDTINNVAIHKLHTYKLLIVEGIYNSKTYRS